LSIFVPAVQQIENSGGWHRGDNMLEPHVIPIKCKHSTYILALCTA